jgi:hypothetical protein
VALIPHLAVGYYGVLIVYQTGHETYGSEYVLLLLRISAVDPLPRVSTVSQRIAHLNPAGVVAHSTYTPDGAALGSYFTAKTPQRT